MTGTVAVWTMVRNEDHFLKLWVEYYARFLPKDCLFVIVDGADSSLPDAAQGCQVITVPRTEVGPGWDRARWQFLSAFVTSLTYRFDVVMGGDVDELIVLDPAVGPDPIQHILSDTQASVISPFAIEILHRIDIEQPLSWDQPILEQRRYGRLNFSYCKPCITRVPINWSLGQHYADHPELALSEDLFLFHLRYVDQDFLRQRQRARAELVFSVSGQNPRDIAGGGWQKSASAMDAFLESFVTKGPPEDTDFTFDWQRRRFRKSWQLDHEEGLWRHTKLHNRRTYTLPERFKGVF